MNREIKAPAVGESITEVRLGAWKKRDGDAVKVGDVLLEIESDKATVEIVAEYAGALRISRQPGETVKIGELLGSIDEGAAGAVAGPSAPAGATASPGPIASAPQAPLAASASANQSVPMSPAVRRVATESSVDVSAVPGTGRGGRVTKGDVLAYVESGARPAPAQTPASTPTTTSPNADRERRVQMPLIRQKIAERLVQAQHTAAILTTFNECDMTEVNNVRNQHKEAFKAKHGVPLSYMSFFTRACVEALKTIPAVNAMIDGKEMVFRDYFDIGVAVGTPRGLVVPVLRDVGKMGFVDIEKGIGALALKARDGKLAIKDLSGGTFTISNGGTYGSLLSTPILNPPQSGILGMHKIQDRPMAIDGKVVVRPMMYLALSYDHRMIDGKEAVTFLIKVKEGIEKPSLLGLEF